MTLKPTALVKESSLLLCFVLESKSVTVPAYCRFNRLEWTYEAWDELKIKCSERDSMCTFCTCCQIRPRCDSPSPRPGDQSIIDSNRCKHKASRMHLTLECRVKFSEMTARKDFQYFPQVRNSQCWQPGPCLLRHAGTKTDALDMVQQLFVGFCCSKLFQSFNSFKCHFHYGSWIGYLGFESVTCTFIIFYLSWSLFRCICESKFCDVANMIFSQSTNFLCQELPAAGTSSFNIELWIEVI